MRRSQILSVAVKVVPVALCTAVLLTLFLVSAYILRTPFFPSKADAVQFLVFVVLATIAARLARRALRGVPALQDASSFPWEDFVFLVFLGLGATTSFSRHPGYYFLDWTVADGSLAAFVRSRMVWFFALSIVFVALFAFLHSRRWLDWALPGLFVGAEILCALALWQFSHGLPVWSDDHPSFLFRIQEFWHSLPWRENYVPHWNAGVVNSVISSSGVTAYALLTSPLRLFSRLPHETHTAGLFLVFSLIVPWTVIWGMRACRFAWRETWTAGLLTLFANRAFFCWAYHYGTIGFGTSVAFTPAAFLFLYAVAEKRLITFGNILGLIFSMTFLCQWPPMCSVVSILALAVLTSWRRWLCDRRTFAALALSAVIVLALLFPMIRSVAGAKDLVGFTMSSRPELDWSTTPRSIIQSLCLGLGDIVARIHPVTLVLGFGGLWILREKPMRRWLSVTILCLWAFFAVGTVLFPRMQLTRMVIPISLLAIVPAAIHAARVWFDRRAATAFLPAAVLALFVLGIPNTARLCQGDGIDKFRVMPQFNRDFAEWIRENVPEGSRLLYVGRTVHTYGRGHVAYMPILAGREMMACDYYEFPKGTFEPDYPPRAVRAKPGGEYAFMVLHGVSHAVAFRQEHINRLLADREHYEEVPGIASGPKSERFHMFRVKGSHGVFLKGDGIVESDFNRLRVTFAGEPPDVAVIAYNWHDRLEADAPAEIAPYDTGTTLGPDLAGRDQPVRFIEIHPNGSREVLIRYRPRF